MPLLITFAMLWAAATAPAEPAPVEATPAGAASAAQAAGASTEADKAPARKVVCFGDSITFGYKLEEREHDSYPAQLQALLDQRYGRGASSVVNEGISGQDTRQGLKRLDAMLAKDRPDWVLIEYGTNDLWTTRNIDPEETDHNLREMIRRIEAAGARVIIATLPPVWDFEEKVAEINRIIKAVAIEEDLPLADLNKVMIDGISTGGDVSNKADWLRYYLWADDDEGVHPNAEGYRLLVREWFDILSKAIDDEVARKAPSAD